MTSKDNEKKTSFNFNKIFQRFLFILPIGVIINLVISYVTWDHQMTNYIHSFSPQYLCIAAVLSLTPWFTHSARIFIWTRFLKREISLKKIFRIVLGTELGAAMSPGIIGGGPIKAGMLMQVKFSPGASLFLTLLGSIEDWLFYCIAVPLALFFTDLSETQILQDLYHGFKNAINLGYGVTALVGIALFFRLNTSLRKKIISNLSQFKIVRKSAGKFKHFMNDIRLIYRMILREGKMYFILSATLTCSQWICRYSIVYFILLSLGFTINPVKLFLLQAIIFSISIFIPTPGATGGAEATFFYIFQNIIPSSIIGIVLSGWRFLTYYFQVTMGTIIFMFAKSFNEDTGAPQSFEYPKMSKNQTAYEPSRHFAQRFQLSSVESP